MLITGVKVHCGAEKVHKDADINWLLLSSPSAEEIKQVKKEQHLPAVCFKLAEERSLAFFLELETFYHEPVYMLHIPLWQDRSYVSNEGADQSVTFIYTDKMALLLLSKEDPSRIQKKLETGESPYTIMVDRMLSACEGIDKELNSIQPRIDRVTTEAKEKANRSVLLDLTELEQNVVVFSRRIDDLEEALSQWLGEKRFKTLTPVNKRAEVALKLKKTQYTSHLYQELIESTSGLISDSIDNKLNSIMEFLESVALVISIPTLIFSLFGMNTGGLAGRESPAETLVVIAVSIVLGAAVAVYLKRKEYL
ncbi:Magnesium and cobalt transport protein CorA [Alkalibacterium sp. AK22]|uniref:CorA family divalent cation transporter n=1 Tax=Alkalibacterium sp. AK22 TaxID=1229520 RepID=UPI000447F7C7|nr:CorA family divalent cation transporter [Alkalibacterium sp. AK22]EXJ23203.1 Magnesium and cobalt transport protein CorA [Alkalibacterium sp. AK22]